MSDKNNARMGRLFTGMARRGFNGAASARGWDAEFLIGIILAAAAVVVLWWTPLLSPFRIFTVSAHEVSHMVAAYAVGGSASQIQLFWNGGGVTFINIPTGWLPAIITYSAGYLGSVAFGGFLLLQSKRPTTRRHLLYGISIALIIVAALFMRDVTSLILVGIAVVLAGGVAYKAPNIVVMFMVYVMAILSCFNAVSDLLGLIFMTANPFHGGFNDAVGLESATGIPALIWALVWGAIGTFMMVYFIRRAIRRAPAVPAATKGYTPSTPAERTAFDRYDDYLSKK